MKHSLLDERERGLCLSAAGAPILHEPAMRRPYTLSGPSPIVLLNFTESLTIRGATRAGEPALLSPVYYCTDRAVLGTYHSDMEARAALAEGYGSGRGFREMEPFRQCVVFCVANYRED